MKTLVIVLCLIFLASCKNSTHKSTELTLNDVPYFDKTGKQSLYRNISPYEAKGIEAPDNDESEEKYLKPYSSFDFVENAYNELNDMGYIPKIAKSEIEFYHNLQDSIYACKVYNELSKHSSKSYLGSKTAFLDSIKNSVAIFSKPVDHNIKIESDTTGFN